jgi:tRNA A-37 threonylcarbamoyl transferase component Bud32/energy-coupling factor transporter ATP-binding protein EcfA2
MMGNPYKYTGPLDLLEDRLVFIPRAEESDRVINGIGEGKFWAIMGPRQIGKSTFLRQLENIMANHFYCLSFSFETFPPGEENFYQWLIQQFCRQVPSEPVDDTREVGHFASHFRFYYFLEKFKPKEHNKKVILFFDEIERIPSVKNFLHLWRQVFHERNRIQGLHRYNIVITGASDLLALTAGPNSPFNIAEKLYLQDFSYSDTTKLIVEPFARLGISIDKNAREEIIAQTSGHPQLTQQACRFLVDTARKEKRGIVKNDVDKAINYLFRESTNLDTLKLTLENNTKLERLSRDILGGAVLKYHPRKEFGVTGAGPIVEDERQCCAIRNQIYERFLRDILDISAESRYKIIEKLGAGSMGVVYKAEDTVLKRTVALKMLTNTLFENKFDLDRLKEEAYITAKLSHRNIVTIYDIGEIPEGHFISMEFIEGENLWNIIARNKKLTFSHILYITRGLLNALDYSHRMGITHRDIKPQNIMINLEGEIKIVDFGIAVLRKYDPVKNSDMIMGTPYYISPEQIKGEDIDHRTDIYSTGVTLFHMVTGTVPFKGKSIYKQHLSSPVPSLMELRKSTPVKMEKIIKKCMEKSRQKRFQNVGELMEALGELESLKKDGTVIKKEIKEILDRVIGKTTRLDTLIEDVNDDTTICADS